MHLVTALLYVRILAAALPPAAETLTFDDAIAQASQRNLDLQSAQARLSQANETARKVWAAYLPQIGVGGSYTRNSVQAKITLPVAYAVRNTGVNVPPANDPASAGLPGDPTTYSLVPYQFQTVTVQPYNQFAAQAQLNQALIYPALWPAIRNAYLAERVAALSTENVRIEILFSVAQMYYGAASLRESLGVQQRLLQINIDHEADAQRRFDAGAATKLEVLRAQIDRKTFEQDVVRTQNAYLSAKSGLAALLDREPDFEVARPVEPQLSNQSEVRPDVRTSRASLELAQGTRRGVWYQYAPSLGVNGTYRLSNFTGFTGRYDSWSVTLALNWTLWEGGLRESALRENAAKVVEASANLRAIDLKARDEVRRARLDLESARANHTKAEETLQLARQTSDLVKTNYANGAATYLQVADANASLLNAELNAIGETLNAQLAILKLNKANGTFHP